MAHVREALARLTWPAVWAVFLVGCRAPGRPAEITPRAWQAGTEEAALAALERAVKAAEKIDDFTCLFHRRERVGDYLGTPQRMEVKFRKRPFSLYMRWVDRRKAGAEFLYVAGRYDGKAFARRGGVLGWLLPTVRVAPDDPLILRHSRHRITDFGLERASRLILDSARRARALGQLKARPLGEGEVHGEAAAGYELLLPDRPGFYARHVEVWFDPAAGLLKRLVAYDAAGRLLEDYAYTRLRANVGLTDADFDPRNPEYRFYR